MTKLIIAFRNFANAPNKQRVSIHRIFRGVSRYGSAGSVARSFRLFRPNALTNKCSVQNNFMLQILNRQANRPKSLSQVKSFVLKTPFASSPQSSNGACICLDLPCHNLDLIHPLCAKSESINKTVLHGKCFMQ